MRAPTKQIALFVFVIICFAGVLTLWEIAPVRHENLGIWWIAQALIAISAAGQGAEFLSRLVRREKDLLQIGPLASSQNRFWLWVAVWVCALLAMLVGAISFVDSFALRFLYWLVVVSIATVSGAFALAIVRTRVSGDEA